MVFVYLDQNFWIRLTAARQGRAAPGFAELLEACESAADNGRAQFVLSFANYEENWRRGRLADRIAVAETMERLTGFATMRTVWRLHEDEVTASLCHILPVDVTEPTPVFGRGIGHLLPVSPFEMFSEAFRAQLTEDDGLRSAAGLYIEQASLVGSMFEGSDVESRRPDRDRHDAYIQRRMELATNLRAAGNSPDLARRLVLAAEFNDMYPTIVRISPSSGTSFSSHHDPVCQISLPGALSTVVHNNRHSGRYPFRVR